MCLLARFLQSQKGVSSHVNVWSRKLLCFPLLSSKHAQVTTTMVLTVRKFVSLIVSIMLFNNQWSVAHWIGTSLVFGGAFIYGADSLFGTASKRKSE